MESPRGETPVPTPSSGRGQEVGPGLRKIRPLEASRKFEVMDLEAAKSNKTFSNPISVNITAGHDALGTDFEVPHSLGKIPVDFMIGSKTADVNIWRGSREWTRSAIYLRAGAAVTATLYLVP